MSERASWKDVKVQASEGAKMAYDDEARISEFQDVAYRLRTDAGLTQVELAERMGITQSAVARMEGGGIGQRRRLWSCWPRLSYSR